MTGRRKGSSSCDSASARDASATPRKESTLDKFNVKKWIQQSIKIKDDNDLSSRISNLSKQECDLLILEMHSMPTSQKASDVYTKC
mmetsp:Transcript_58930/g.156058  ORF Transcript_58930/g.156058 Transcript_58930/m.156058 type:complete len:86 (-) Transcript_58930:889-1146(-)|eukprot:CAMPEP_0113704034 /NCGR_PEP_ID=MMETSP0038_2-20120614/26264_1 /TAXON_ID=2898 /ORGANISM="Cryptomonas paramecium" /LENGTH=85 /DNA_ID=CAMNT_0000628709 /DNA_START=92 /DNA_END=349 /DNA_ORIENTATION=+ /assembly_acc=CAM_ASM_000170